MSRDPASEQLRDYAASAPRVAGAATASNGAPIDSITNSMTAGARGPIVLQDFTLLDHIGVFSLVDVFVEQGRLRSLFM